MTVGAATRTASNRRAGWACSEPASSRCGGWAGTQEIDGAGLGSQAEHRRQTSSRVILPLAWGPGSGGRPPQTVRPPALSRRLHPEAATGPDHESASFESRLAADNGPSASHGQPATR